MIHIDKSKYFDGSPVIEPTSLTKKNNQNKTEKDKAIEYYSQTPKPKEQFKFEVYKSDDVKETLKKIFNGKCAYCESKYTHIMPMDVEHFRPKSIYYWLASDWDNLLPSCIDCNRERYQIEQNRKKILAGKQHHFPLLGHKAPFKNADHFNYEFDEEENVRQLLHPCIDNPENHLKYDNNGYIFPKPIDELDRGKMSITTYGLYRMELVKARQEHLIRIFSCISRVQNTIFAIDKLIELSIDNPELEKPLDIVIKI